MEDVNYTIEGIAGEQCQDCQNFELKEGNKGNCFGHEVIASGHCNLFAKKA